MLIDKIPAGDNPPEDVNVIMDLYRIHYRMMVTRSTLSSPALGLLCLALS